MDRFDAMRVFAAVADEQGFAAAARRLGMSPPAVTRAIAALEQRIGTLLLHRTTRRVRMTELGRRFLEDCKRILAELDEAEASAAGTHGEPRGQLVITAPDLFGHMYVARIVLDFLARHPAVTARTLMVDRIVDMFDEGIDVAVRIAHLPDSSLSAARVGSVRRVVCASPRFFAKHGVPRTPADLVDFPAIMFSTTGVVQEWSFGTGAGAESVNPRGQLMVNSSEFAIDAAMAGCGLTRVLSYQIAPALRAGRLKVVLAEFEPPPVPIHVVHREGRRAAARVRAFVDFAVERLRAEPTLA